MPNVTLRDATADDTESVCALNLAEVRHTSPMDAPRAAALAALACYFRVACVEDRVAAFLLAMGSGASYESDNYAWFARRYPRFVYVDRIVVSAQHRGMRLGSLLYQDLFRYARDHGFRRVTCEYNIDPPNEASRAFHATFGFREVGTQWVAGGAKHVSLQVAQIRSPAYP